MHHLLPATFHTTNRPSLPAVDTLFTFPFESHSYASTLVIEFWCTVESNPSAPTAAIPAEVGVFPALPLEDLTPLESACLNKLKASLLSRPGPPDTTRLPVADGVRVRVPEDAGSSSECEKDQPEEDPLKMTGWQSWPAATMVSSDAKVKVMYGRDGHRTEIRAAGGSPGPAG